MTSRTHTHTGNCQACGKSHAVNVKTGKIAKHGYTTRFGFFSGTCAGSDKLTLNVARDFADKIIVDARGYAADQDERAKGLRAGSVTVPYVWGGDYERGADGKVKRDRDMKRIPLMVEWEKAEPNYRADAVELAIRQCAENAAGARAFAAAHPALIAAIHGTPLHSVKPVDVVADAPLAVGDTVRLFGKDGYDVVVEKIETREAHGCGPHLNGRHVPHAIYTRPNGSRGAYPVSRIRKAAIIKRAGQ
jgi:hypothetical protein